MHAYNTGDSSVSCLKGISERILLNINSAAIALSAESNLNDETKQFYKKIQDMFTEFNLSVQQWAEYYLDDSGAGAAELRELTTPESRKQHFINFMTTKYGGRISEEMRHKILDEAEKYENMGVFINLAFGVKKRRKQNLTKRRKQSKKRRFSKRKKN